MIFKQIQNVNGVLYGLTDCGEVYRLVEKLSTNGYIVSYNEAWEKVNSDTIPPSDIKFILGEIDE